MTRRGFLRRCTAAMAALGLPVSLGAVAAVEAPVVAGFDAARAGDLIVYGRDADGTLRMLTGPGSMFDDLTRPALLEMRALGP